MVLEKTEVSPKIPRFCSERWRLAYLSFFGFIFVYALRVNLSVAIVCMVKPDNSTNNSTEDETCGTMDISDKDNTRGEFDWDKNVQASILSSFFYGYLVMQIPGGWLAGRFGGKRVLGIAMTVVAIATVLLPVLARQDYRFVFALRVIMGLASGVSFPGMHAMWGRWAPKNERARLSSVCYTGFMFGNILTFIFSGYLCAYGFDNGWGSVFYITGGATFIWLAAWWLLVYDTPETCPRITDAEKNFIISHVGSSHGKQFKVPWIAIAKSKAMWACLTAHICNNWMHYTLMTSLPTFMKEVLHYDIEQNGVLSSVPYITMAVFSIGGGQVADFLQTHCLTTRTTRRAFQSVSFLVGGGCLVGVGFIDCEHRTMAVVLLAVSVGFEGLCYSGYMVNQIDFAPRYAGVLMGITNFIATIPGIIAPEVAGALTPNKTQKEWRNVFYVCGAFTLLGAVVFGGFAETDEQEWAKDAQNPINLEMEIEVKAKNSIGVDHVTEKEARANGESSHVIAWDEDDHVSAENGTTKNRPSSSSNSAFDNKGYDEDETKSDVARNGSVVTENTRM